MFDRLRVLLRRKAVRELIKYGIVGGIGLVVDMGAYFLLVKQFEVHYPISSFVIELFGADKSPRMMDILISSIIGQSLGVINNFILNSIFTFKVTDKKIRRFFSFAGIAAIGMVISSFLLTIFIEGLGLSEMLAKGLAIIIVAMIQFLINKHVTFKQKEQITQ
ncbi:GtrA family protein [Dysgonomonas sp. 25]|uniref:GtrA family protein n=1 Tax=Dysgonomonas sp. 25 TaxID=2302933 RepID=UPI0013D018C5|nr:GtrA family protein [Dysgonomonas sp. 25]NDV69482.1 GtrA family protein [Dysgonomonas sp. 25]